MSKACHWLLFLVLAILAAGQFPTALGWNFLILTILTVPVPELQKIIDRIFSYCSQRLFLVLLCLVCIIRQPVEEFGAAGRQMGRFLCGILAIFDLG